MVGVIWKGVDDKRRETKGMGIGMVDMGGCMGDIEGVDWLRKGEWQVDMGWGD